MVQYKKTSLIHCGGIIFNKSLYIAISTYLADFNMSYR